MSAKFVDALKGYEYYLGQRGEATIDEVNHNLEVHGRRAIQSRTYGHYRKLLAHGFRSYIPINQFDVFQALGKLQMAADRHRYERTKVQMSARISSDLQNWTDALVVDRSLVGFGIIMPERFPAGKGSKVWVRLEDYHDIPVILVWKKFDAKKNITHLGLRAFEFIAKYHQLEEDINASRLTGLLQISRMHDGTLDWQHIFRILDKTNELLKSIADLLYSVNEALDTKLQLAQPVLISIKFGSPGELRTKVDLGAAEILKVLIEKAQYWSLDKERYKQENRKRKLENVNLGIEVVRNAVNFHKEALDAGMSEDAILAILGPIKTVFHVKKLPKGLFGEGTIERGVLTTRVIPVVAELVAGDDPDFEIQASIVKKPRRSTMLGRARPHQRGKPRM